MADSIAQLPKTMTLPSEHDMRVMSTIFGSPINNGSYELRGLIVPSILFFALSLPIADTMLNKFITTSNIVLLAIKTGIFILLLLICQLFHIA